jgi:hypothetical protein
MANFVDRFDLIVVGSGFMIPPELGPTISNQPRLLALIDLPQQALLGEASWRTAAVIPFRQHPAFPSPNPS